MLLIERCAARCTGCGKETNVVEVDSVSGVVASSVREDWIVYTYPPGDDGLHYACSIECLRKTYEGTT